MQSGNFQPSHKKMKSADKVVMVTAICRHSQTIAMDELRMRPKYQFSYTLDLLMQQLKLIKLYSLQFMSTLLITITSDTQSFIQLSI